MLLDQRPPTQLVDKALLATVNLIRDDDIGILILFTGAQPSGIALCEALDVATCRGKLAPRPLFCFVISSSSRTNSVLHCLIKHTLSSDSSALQQQRLETAFITDNGAIHQHH